MKMKLFLLLSVLAISQIITSAFKQQTILPKSNKPLVPLAPPQVVTLVKSDNHPSRVNQMPSNSEAKQAGLKSTNAKQTKDKICKPNALPSRVDVVDTVPKTKIENKQHDIFESKNGILSRSKKFQNFNDTKDLEELKVQEESWNTELEYDSTPPTRLQRAKAYITQHPYKTAAIIIVVSGIVTAVIVAYKKGYLKNPYAKAIVKKTKKVKRKPKFKKRK